MLYNICYITYPELLYNIQVWLYNIQDGYITHPNLPDDDRSSSVCPSSSARPRPAGKRQQGRRESSSLHT